MSSSAAQPGRDVGGSLGLEDDTGAAALVCVVRLLLNKEALEEEVEAFAEAEDAA